jgi:hypothetical protein
MNVGQMGEGEQLGGDLGGGLSLRD